MGMDGRGGFGPPRAAFVVCAGGLLGPGAGEGEPAGKDLTHVAREFEFMSCGRAGLAPDLDRAGAPCFESLVLNFEFRVPSLNFEFRTLGSEMRCTARV